MVYAIHVWQGTQLAVAISGHPQLFYKREQRCARNNIAAKVHCVFGTPYRSSIGGRRNQCSVHTESTYTRDAIIFMCEGLPLLMR